MVFNSLKFVIFLLVIFLLYWKVFNRSKTSQNSFLLISSYIFYCFWDYRFLFLLIASTCISWCVGIAIERNAYDKRKCRRLSAANIIFSVGVLIVFKYYNFFVQSFMSHIGISPDKLLINVLLPVGASFYLFKSMSYTIDVYKGKIEAEKNFIDFALYMGFFPHILAGPVDRASNMLPQLSLQRIFSYNLSACACKQILWGAFKKVVVADNCARYVDFVFADYTSLGASSMLFAAVLYAIQIYSDFSGYSDMAIGIGKLFGISAKKNFDFPYFSRNMPEFWRKWHISLTSWFTEYIYIPLGGNRCAAGRVVLNTVIVFLISGLWHGARWTFALWGLYHALLFIPGIVFHNRRKYTEPIAKNRILPNIKEIFQMAVVFCLTLPGWVLFRSTGLKTAFGYFTSMAHKSILSIPYLMNPEFYIPLFCSIVILVVVEWMNRGNGIMFNAKSKTVGYLSYAVILAAVVYYFLLSVEHDNNFIYMAF